MGHRQIELDDRGIDYVLEHLRGVNRLCDGLADVVETARGHVFTVLPDNTPADQVYNFKRGGLNPENGDMSRVLPLRQGQGFLVPVADLADLRGELILEALNAHPGSVCLCDDFNPRWSDEIARSTPNTFGVGEEAYHLLTAATGLEVIVDTLRFTDTIWHGAAAVCSQGLELCHDRTADPSALEVCAKSVVQLSCTAYDREGLVVWMRSDV